MKQVISKTEHMNKKGWLLTAKEVEDKVREKLGFKEKQNITSIDSFRHNVVTVDYTEGPLLIKKGSFFYEQDLERKRVHIKKDEFLSWFGIKPIEKKDISIEPRVRFQGMFIEQYNNPEKQFVPEEDSFYFFAVNKIYREIIEEAEDEKD